MQPQKYTAAIHLVLKQHKLLFFVVLIVSYIVQTILDSPNAIGL
jgi:hypothetical protein